MTSAVQDISVIMPTLARAQRAAGLYRAIDSVLTQEGVRALPIVVVNGDQFDPALLNRLRADSRIRLVERRDAGIPGAMRAGREAVTTPWFGALDDDDFLLPAALAPRIQVLLEHPEATAVVTNGYRRTAEGDELHVTTPELVRRDPFGQLLERNWLLPGSWLCRSAAIGTEVFDEMPQFLECTYMAVRFAMSGRMLFLSEPTVVWHVGTADSASASRPHRLGSANALQQLLRLSLPAAFRAGVRRKFAEECHTISDIFRLEGNRREAWRWHLRSLRAPSGLRYLGFTRHLFTRLEAS